MGVPGTSSYTPMIRTLTPSQIQGHTSRWYPFFRPTNRTAEFRKNLCRRSGGLSEELVELIVPAPAMARLLMR